MGKEVEGTTDTRNFNNELCPKNNGGIRYTAYIFILLIVCLTFGSETFCFSLKSNNHFFRILKLLNNLLNIFSQPTFELPH